MRLIYIIISVLLFIGGCTSTQHIKKEKIVTPPITISTVEIVTPTPIIMEEEIIEEKKRVIKKRHKNSQLKKIMNNLDYILFSRINLEVQEGEDDLFFTKNTKKTLKKFVEDTKKVQFLYPNADDEYIRLSKALTRASIKLYKIVEAKKMEWVRPQVDNIMNICNSCHDLYVF